MLKERQVCWVAIGTIGRTLITAVIAVLLNAATASATLVANFDVGDTTAPAVPGGTPVAGPAGTPTSWGLIHSGNVGAPPTENGIQFFISNGTAFINSRAAYEDLLSDYYYENAGTIPGVANWRLTGLTIGTPYDLYLLSADGTGFSSANTYDTNYRVYDGDPGANGINAGSVNELDSALVSPVDTSPGFNGTWIEGTNYAILSFVANATSMYGTFEEGLAGHHYGIAGIQLDDVTPPVPEPSSFLLLGLGALGLIRHTRRRRRRA